MSRSKLWLILLLTLVALLLIGWNLSNSNSDQHKVVVQSDDPNYQSKFTNTLVYDPTGALQYQLTARNVKHYSNQQDSWFYQPVLTLFDKNTVATWTIHSNSAKLTKDRMLYLYGNVKVRSLVSPSQLKTIDTSSALINLITQDVSSEEEVVLGGESFYSKGLKMRGNLREKHADLIEKVKTIYEIKNP